MKSTHTPITRDGVTVNVYRGDIESSQYLWELKARYNAQVLKNTGVVLPDVSVHLGALPKGSATRLKGRPDLAKAFFVTYADETPDGIARIDINRYVGGRDIEAYSERSLVQAIALGYAAVIAGRTTPTDGKPPKPIKTNSKVYKAAEEKAMLNPIDGLLSTDGEAFAARWAKEAKAEGLSLEAAVFAPERTTRGEHGRLVAYFLGAINSKGAAERIKNDDTEVKVRVSKSVAELLDAMIAGAADKGKTVRFVLERVPAEVVDETQDETQDAEPARVVEASAPPKKGGRKPKPTAPEANVPQEGQAAASA